MWSRWARTTQPYTAPAPAHLQAGRRRARSTRDSGLDLDLDLALPDAPLCHRTHADTGRERTALSPRPPIWAATTRWTSAWMTTSPKTVPVKRSRARSDRADTMAMPASATRSPSDGLDFDLGDITG
jgi:hypothetical protein